MMQTKTKAEIEDRQRESQRYAAPYFEKARMTEKFKEQTSLAEPARIENDNITTKREGRKHTSGPGPDGGLKKMIVHF